MYSLDPNDLDALQTFVKVQLADRKVATELKPVPVSYEKMVLVCTHASRDKRCGRAGPQVRLRCSRVKYSCSVTQYLWDVACLDIWIFVRSFDALLKTKTA